MSFRATLIKRILKAYNSRQVYDLARIDRHRKVARRVATLIFPAVSRKVRRTSVAGVSALIIDAPTATKRTIVYLHGGGFVFGLTNAHLKHMIRLAKMCQAKVIAIDYSLAPEHPYPYALEEIQRVWQQLLADKTIDPRNVALVGDSAGANLALASSMRWRDAGLLQPACLVLLSPGLDATLSGESYHTKNDLDPILSQTKLEFFTNAYAGDFPKSNPFISPIYANLKGLPHALLHIGSDEMLLSDAQTMMKNANRDGIDISLHIGDGMWHCWHLFAPYIPEANDAMRLAAKYIFTHTGK